MAKRPVGARVDENLYKAFKCRAILEGRTVEALLALVILQYLAQASPLTIMPGLVGTYQEYRKAMQAIEQID